jgi:hypothetical protein
LEEEKVIAFQVEGDTVDEIVGKLVELTSRLQGCIVEDVSPTVAEGSTAPKSGRGRPKKEAAKEPATETPVAPPASPVSNPSPPIVPPVDPMDDLLGGSPAPPAPAMTEADFKAKCQAFVQSKGVDTFRKHLATFGATKAGELKPEQWQNFLSLFQ